MRKTLTGYDVLVMSRCHNKDISNNAVFALKFVITEQMTLNDSCHRHA